MSGNVMESVEKRLGELEDGTKALDEKYTSGGRYVRLSRDDFIKVHDMISETLEIMHTDEVNEQSTSTNIPKAEKSWYRANGIFNSLCEIQRGAESTYVTSKIKTRYSPVVD